MKKVAVTVAVLALGLAACEADTEENAVGNEVVLENEAGTDLNMGMDDANMAADNALDVATNAIDNVQESAENAAEAIENVGENATN
jgi:uncharacterized protein YcfL